jgi:hypothetical protein
MHGADRLWYGELALLHEELQYLAKSEKCMRAGKMKKPADVLHALVCRGTLMLTYIHVTAICSALRRRD